MLDKKLEVVELKYYNSVVCDGCKRHNFSESTRLKERYTDVQMYELSARSVTTVLCKDCLHALRKLIESTLEGGINNEK